MTPLDLARALPDSQVSETEPGVYLARLPLVVAQGASLEIGKETRDFRLSQERGAVLVNDVTACSPGDAGTCLDRLILSSRMMGVRFFK